MIGDPTPKRSGGQAWRRDLVHVRLLAAGNIAVLALLVIVGRIYARGAVAVARDEVAEAVGVDGWARREDEVDDGDGGGGVGGEMG